MQDNQNKRELNALIEQRSAIVTTLRDGMSQTIVGQRHLVDALIIGLLADGHILLEGVPGLAKTLAIKTLSSLIDADFSRIQFTPDLLPADVVGTQIYSQSRGKKIRNKQIHRSYGRCTKIKKIKSVSVRPGQRSSRCK